MGRPDVDGRDPFALAGVCDQPSLARPPTASSTWHSSTEIEKIEARRLKLFLEPS